MRSLKTTYKTHPREYVSWTSMKQRCLNKNHVNYYRYGGRGITVCQEWIDSFEQFVWDMGVRPYGKSIDRIDNSLGYFPENCRWATPYEQIHNSSIVKLSEMDVDRIRTISEYDLLTHEDIAFVYGVERSTITKIVNWQERLGDLATVD